MVGVYCSFKFKCKLFDLSLSVLSRFRSLFLLLFCVFLLFNNFLSASLNSQEAFSKEHERDNLLQLEHLLVLGAGSALGEDYKINIFESLRSCANKVYLCELEDNDLVEKLLNRKLIDEFIPVKALNPEVIAKEVIDYFLLSSVDVNCVVTYRDEWLEARVLIASHFGLPHPRLEAVNISKNKYRTKKELESRGIPSCKYAVSNRKSLWEVGNNFGFPFFIKPVKGIRSEWSRWITRQSSFEQYTHDIDRFSTYDGLYLLEEALEGHEVDADIVVYDGQLMYAVVSDNFPTYKPFALETGHLMPSILSCCQQQRIVKLAYEAVKACGYDRGVFHVELILTKGGDIAVLEVNARLGGMYIAEWHKELWGCDLIKAELAISAGMNPTPYLNKQGPRGYLALTCSPKTDPLKNRGSCKNKT